MGRCVGGARRKGWWNQALDQAPANEGLTFDDWPPEIRVVTGAKSSGQSADRSGDQSGDQSGAGFRDTDGYAIGRRGRRTKATESRTRATTGRQTSLSSNKMEAATTTKGRVETAPAQPAGGPVKPRKPRKTQKRHNARVKVLLLLLLLVVLVLVLVALFLFYYFVSRPTRAFRRPTFTWPPTTRLTRQNEKGKRCTIVCERVCVCVCGFLAIVAVSARPWRTRYRVTTRVTELSSNLNGFCVGSQRARIGFERGFSSVRTESKNGR